MGSLYFFLHLSHLKVALETVNQELAFFVADIHEIAGILSHGVLQLDPLLHVLLPLLLQVVLVAVIESLQFVAVVLKLRVSEVIHLFDGSVQLKHRGFVLLDLLGKGIGSKLYLFSYKMLHILLAFSHRLLCKNCALFPFLSEGSGHLLLELCFEFT